jgi:SagB-type dehydrogenase family enzyme
MSENLKIESTHRYHELTKHSYQSIRLSPHYLDWAIKPSPFKVYPELEPIALPRGLLKTGYPALEALARGPSGPMQTPRPSLEQLASILYFSAGVTRVKEYAGGRIYFRAAACAGALYPTEIYLVCGDIEELAAGVYHFSPGDFSLRRLREGDYRGVLVKATAAYPVVASAPVTLIFSSISWRSTWKYRDRAYRYHFWDNGTILANALAMAYSHGIPAQVILGFIDSEIENLTGIDGARELALSLMTLGREENGVAAANRLPEPVSHEAIPLSTSEVDYPAIREAYRTSSLAGEAEVSAWRKASLSARPIAAGEQTIALALPAANELPGVSIEAVIERRASTRRFATRPITLQDLSVILYSATREVAADYSTGGAQLNELYLIINRVEGLSSGAYYYHKDKHAIELLKEGDFSERARYLTLEQDLGGDAAVTVFFMADLDRGLAAYGNRGYRVAQMEAGIMGGRIYLAAYALRRGATGLTFYDDDVTEFFKPHAAGMSCIFVTSIGVPGKRPIF